MAGDCYLLLAPGLPPPDLPPLSLPLYLSRNFTRSSSPCGSIVWPNVSGITLGGNPGAILALGSTIDFLTSEGLIPGITVSRSGPTVPEAPAAFMVWQPAH